jgi:hypothetical protein
MALDERVTQAVRQALGHERDVVMSAKSGSAEERGSIVRRVFMILAGITATKLAYARARGTAYPTWVSGMLAAAAAFFAVGAATAPKVARKVADRIGTEEDEPSAEADEPVVAHEGNGGVPVGAR